MSILIHLNLFFTLTFTIWKTIDPYLVGGMPLVDLVDLLNVTGEGLGSVGSIFEILIGPNSGIALCRDVYINKRTHH